MMHKQALCTITNVRASSSGGLIVGMTKEEFRSSQVAMVLLGRKEEASMAYEKGHRQGRRQVLPSRHFFRRIATCSEVGGALWNTKIWRRNGP